MPSETISKLGCLRCGYRWFPRSERKPVRCPSCKSPYWDRARAGTANDESERRMEAKVAQMRAGKRYYEQHEDEIVAKFEGKWIAATGAGVLDADTDRSELMDRVFKDGSFSLYVRKVGAPTRVYRIGPRFRVRDVRKIRA